MKKIVMRATSVLLVFCMIFSLSTVSVFAEEKTAAEAVRELNMNFPVVEIPGFGEGIYSGLSTETELDDSSIWSFSADDIMTLVKEHAGNLILCLLTGNFKKLDVIFTDVLSTIFGDAACDENGIPDPDTGIKARNEVYPKNEYGYRNSYSFHYDWRLDMHTIASQLHEYINRVMEVTGSEKVGLVCFSMGGSVTMTYLYEYYYSASEEDRDHIHSVVFLAGAMNGVGCCEDPFSGNIVFDSTSLMRMLQEMLSTNTDMLWLYTMLNIMYSLRMLEPIVSFANNYLVSNLSTMVDNAMLESIGTIPGFYALMSYERYYDAENFIFDSEEDKARFAGLIEKNRYYHESVQTNSDAIIKSILDDGKNFAVISEYGYSMLPVTSDNDRMSDGTIETFSTSFGATCAAVDGTLGADYVQAVACPCGGNHISPDNQIDSSTCKYPDVTWFAKNVKHASSDRYFADMIDLITYSKNQVTVWTYPDLPQYMINQLDLRLIPMTAANAGQVIPFDETTVIAQFFKNLFG